MKINSQWLIDRLSACLLACDHRFKPALERVRIAVAQDATPGVSDVSTALIGALVVSDEGFSVSSLKAEIEILRHECHHLRHTNRLLNEALAHHRAMADEPPPRQARAASSLYSSRVPPRPKPGGGFVAHKEGQRSSFRLNQKRAALGLPTGEVVTLEDGTRAFKLDNL